MGDIEEFSRTYKSRILGLLGAFLGSFEFRNGSEGKPVSFLKKWFAGSLTAKELSSCCLISQTNLLKVSINFD